MSASTIVTALILNVVIGFKLIAYNIYISVTCKNKVNENNKKYELEMAWVMPKYVFKRFSREFEVYYDKQE